MITIRAVVYFLSEEEGGLSKNGVSGMQPSFSVKNDLIMCTVIGESGTTEFVPGSEYNVTIEVPYGELFSDEIRDGYRFTLNIGGHKFAHGTVL